MKETIRRIESEYRKIAKSLSAPESSIRFFETPQHDGSPHIEYEGRDLCYVVTERGSEFERRRTQNPDEMLYWLIRDLTREMANDWELRNRKSDEDCRIQFFSKHVELLDSIRKDWAEKTKHKYEKLLPKAFN